MTVETIPAVFVGDVVELLIDKSNGPTYEVTKFGRTGKLTLERSETGQVVTIDARGVQRTDKPFVAVAKPVFHPGNVVRWNGPKYPKGVDPDADYVVVKGGFFADVVNLVRLGGEPNHSVYYRARTTSLTLVEQ